MSWRRERKGKGKREAKKERAKVRGEKTAALWKDCLSHVIGMASRMLGREGVMGRKR